jgi:hypothetical protein
MLIPQVLETHVNTSGEEPDEKIHVKEERGPGGGLMLRDGRNDGNMDLSIASVEQGVESATPRRNVSKRGQKDQAAQTDQASRYTRGNHNGSDLSTGNNALDEEDEGDHLKEAKNT